MSRLGKKAALRGALTHGMKVAVRTRKAGERMTGTHHLETAEGGHVGAVRAREKATE